MRPKLALVVALVVVALGFAYLAPVINIPAQSQSGCNSSCAPPGPGYTVSSPLTGGLSDHYVSLSYRLIGQGAWYWAGPDGTYELLNTPFGSFG
ncbi:MAG TPA: hypothetical protein VLY65_01275 [Nitrososphaerales archaeon]|nr:hypothetical protein [Nitrososphaerales archaeon]